MASLAQGYFWCLYGSNFRCLTRQNTGVQDFFFIFRRHFSKIMRYKYSCPLLREKVQGCGEYFCMAFFI